MTYCDPRNVSKGVGRSTTYISSDSTNSIVGPSSLITLNLELTNICYLSIVIHVSLFGVDRYNFENTFVLIHRNTTYVW